MKLAICNETFQNTPWDATCEQVAQCGYQGIEIAPFTLASDIRTLDPQERQQIRQTAEAHHLEIVGLHWLLVSPENLSLTANDPNIRTFTASYLTHLVDFCADLGGKILVLGSPKQRRIPEGATSITATERLVEAILPALNRCAQRNITLCLEPLPAPEADLILTLDSATSVIESVAHPNLQTILDVKSATSDIAPIPDLIHRHAPHIAHFHANDGNRRGPGTGDTDFVPILQALKQIEYDGYLSIEVFDYTPDALTIASDGIRYLKSCIQQLG